MTWEGFLTTKSALWINTGSNTNKILHGSCRAVAKSGILLQIEKECEANGGVIKCHVFSPDDPTARLNLTNPSDILTIEQ